ncbi:SAM-dependent methyltransferase [Amycolatopsis coloradensis]|uniref:SAM-dependent methyltransferase n=1 Tax=Amycolatopsis coloradensis TaxID=76021 RepID=A0A1R0KUS9_9PSEU|nr:methyltransferase domain-containing protein [Amycolatopsis coloradensis]OLZ52390.1 SAM-dependent methyltransferase [Amycolatopsis coloradensis]
MGVQQSTTAQTRDGLLFLGEFARRPLKTAAIAPSSPALAAGMVAPVPESGQPVVVELGAGTGSFTKAIQHKLRGRGRHVAIELNPKLADLLRHRYPGVDVVCADATELPSVLEQRDLGPVDVVVSGLPWVSFPTEAGRSLATSVADSLSPNGVFTQFTYSWTRWANPARTRLQALRERFEEVVVSTTVWRNLPPAAVYVARRARRVEA